MLVRDVRHRYRDLLGRAGACRVRAFSPSPAAGGLPVVIVSDLLDAKPGPSITNEAETIAAELLSQYLAEQDGREPPYVYIEHYPDTDCRRDALGTEHFDLVTFAHYRVKPTWWNPQRGLVQRFGEPEWRRVERAEVERLIGEPLPEPACTCQRAPTARADVQR